MLYTVSFGIETKFLALTGPFLEAGKLAGSKVWGLPLSVQMLHSFQVQAVSPLAP